MSWKREKLSPWRFYFEDHPHNTSLIKEEANMKTKMNEATIQALHKSIAHWNDICYGMEKNIGVSKCALCSEFNRSYLQCGGCPLMQSMQCCYNDRSAYDKYASIRRGFCTVDSADAAEAMLELLVSLLPDDEARRYDCFAGTFTNRGEWSFNYYSDIAAGTVPSTGITTDGRNAFPQAKKVWEKVFEYQASEWGSFGNIKFRMPLYEWAECPTKWWISTTKDGKCVTCGQVVKKKAAKRRTVTKYKVVFEGDGDQFAGRVLYVSVSRYASRDDFQRQNKTLLYISLVKETAKEFDA